MTQISMFDMEPNEPEPFSDFEFDISITVLFRNGPYLVLGTIFERKTEGKYNMYKIQNPDDTDGYSIQWIYEFQIL